MFFHVYQLFVTTYYSGVKPFVGRDKNSVNIKTNAFLLSLTYFTIQFCNLGISSEALYYTGWSMIIYFNGAVVWNMISILKL